MPVIKFSAALLVAALAGAAPQAADEAVLRMRSMPEWMLILMVDPEYPAVALQYRIQGDVRFEAVIGRDGHVERLRLVSGHPLLVEAARAAADQWIYRSTVRDGKPVRVLTQIEIRFRLPRGSSPSATPQATGFRDDAAGNWRLHLTGPALSLLPVC
jgi:TonB family protein